MLCYLGWHRYFIAKAPYIITNCFYCSCYCSDIIDRKSALSHDSASLPTVIKEKDVEYQVCNLHELISM